MGLFRAPRRRPAAGAFRWCFSVGIVLLLAACASDPEREAKAPDPEIDYKQAQADADAAYARGEWREAEPHFVALLKNDPAEASNWFRLANVYAHTDRPDLAVDAYRETLVRDAASGKAWFNMGVVQLRQAANSFLKMSLHVDEDDPFAAQGAQAYAEIMKILGVPETPAANNEVAVTAETQTGATAE